MAEDVVSILADMRNWVRAAAYPVLRQQLETAIPDVKSRLAYQMLDGSRTLKQVRAACKMSPNTVVGLAQRWTAMGLMEVSSDKRRKRLFNLVDFGLADAEDEE